jgi:hypothetical protein
LRTQVWFQKLKNGVSDSIIFKRMLKKLGGRLVAGFVCLISRRSGRILCIEQ